MCETAASFKLVAPAKKKMQETPVSSGNDDEDSDSDSDSDSDDDSDDDDDEGARLGLELLGAAFHGQAVEVKQLL